MSAALAVPGLPERFRIEGPLGGGGQAQTLAGLDTLTGDAVVVKVFRLAGSDAWKRFELFERECAVLRSLNHPSIPAYVEHGGDEDAGTFFLVMQRAPGESLQAQIDAGRRYTDAELESILEGLLDALEYLHSLNPPVIHRDLKPGNVVLGEDGHVWLVDFGSVRDVLGDTRQSTVVGTYGYMAPEQLRGQSSPASDLYGLGATLAAAATGADASKLPSKGLEVELQDVIKPGRLRERLRWMLRADPDARPASVAALRAGHEKVQLAQLRDSSQVVPDLHVGYTEANAPSDAGGNPHLEPLVRAWIEAAATKHGPQPEATQGRADPRNALAGRGPFALTTPLKDLPKPFGLRELKFVGGSASVVAVGATLASGSFAAGVVAGLIAAALAIPFSRGLVRGLDLK